MQDLNKNNIPQIPKDKFAFIHDGDRIAQLMVLPVVQPQLQFVEELDETARGCGGFGSTGR